MAVGGEDGLAGPFGPAVAGSTGPALVRTRACSMTEGRWTSRT